MKTHQKPKINYTNMFKEYTYSLYSDLWLDNKVQQVQL